MAATRPRRGDAAAPGEVGLQNVCATPLDEVVETEMGVFVFAAGNVQPRQALAQLGVAVIVIREQRLFQPIDVVFTQAFGHGDRIRHVPAHPSVDHEEPVRSERVAGRGNLRFILPHALSAVPRPIPHERLYCE